MLRGEQEEKRRDENLYEKNMESNINDFEIPLPSIEIQNEIVAMIRQKIAYYERVKGNIKRDEVEKIEMDEFEVEE